MPIMLFFYASRIHAAGHFEPTPFATPVAAAGFAVPLAHAFPFFAIGDDGVTFIDKFLQCGGRNAVNDGYGFNRAALWTRTSFLASRRLAGFF